MSNSKIVENFLDLQEEAKLAFQKHLLKDTVKEALSDYLAKLDGAFIDNLYELVLSEIERPLLEVVMKYVRYNQSQAAIFLGLSRGTLRKKLKIYGFLK